jgi:hypothetical protein
MASESDVLGRSPRSSASGPGESTEMLYRWRMLRDGFKRYAVRESGTESRSLKPAKFCADALPKRGWRVGCLHVANGVTVAVQRDCALSPTAANCRRATRYHGGELQAVARGQRIQHYGGTSIFSGGSVPPSAV